MSKIGYVYDDRYLLHRTGDFHPERPDRLRAIEQRIQQVGLESRLIHIPVREASLEEIQFVHDRSYINSVAATADQGGVFLDGDTFASPHTFHCSLLAAGGLLQAVDQVEQGEVDRAFAMVRPPGHHAEKKYAMGFCIFNNVAIASEYLLRRYHLKKIAIVDFDVHHGNATQHSFYDRRDVFYISTHRFPFYPGTGAEQERGAGAGAGYTLNIPMSAGAGDEAYREAFEKKILPALRDYDPEALLVSAGFDAHQRDPLGGMNVSALGFRMMAEELQKIANDYTRGKIIYVLEGGYDLKGLAESVEQVLQVLMKD